MQANRLTGVHVTPTVLFNVSLLQFIVAFPLKSSFRALSRIAFLAVSQPNSGTSGLKRTLVRRSKKTRSTMGATSEEDNLRVEMLQ